MTTRIAVPVLGDVMCSHFGQCETFALFDVDLEAATIVSRRDLTPPHHAPGVYPQWLAEQNVTLVLAGGMGGKARDLFADHDIQVMVGVGAPDSDPEAVVRSHLEGRLTAGNNLCDH